MNTALRGSVASLALLASLPAAAQADGEAPQQTADQDVSIIVTATRSGRSQAVPSVSPNSSNAVARQAEGSGSCVAAVVETHPIKADG